MRKIKIIQYILIVVLAVGIGTAAQAATIKVTTTQDNVPGSLRAAITTANTNSEDDTINLPAGTYILSGYAGEDGNISGDLDINTTHSIDIVGKCAATTLIDGNQVDRVFHIHNGTVSISNVTIQNGKSYFGTGGGGIYNNGRLTLTYCEINGNGIEKALSPGDGGGLYNSGTATLRNCTVSNNISGEDKGPCNRYAGDGGGIYNTGEMVLTNCTVSNNETGYGMDGGGDGGGIYNSSGSLTLINCTISNNATPYVGNGGGIYGEATLKNTIVANNQSHYGDGSDCYGTINSLGYNLIEDTSGCMIDGTLFGNITEVDPILGPLADNGGPTRTHALLLGSPAIDAGNSKGIPFDQRGCPRPIDVPDIDNVSDGADIGAFEYDPIYISGRITTNGTGVPGVTLTFSHNGGTTTTDENGNYYHPVESGWTGTVTPSKEDYSFTPASREYTNVISKKTNQNYTAYPFSVSVNIIYPPDGAVVSGIVTITASASSSQARSSIQSITKVEFYIDNVLVETDSTEPYQYSWDTTLYTNGNHTIKVKAANTAMQVKESEITVTVENVWHMTLSRTRLNFGADRSGIKTSSQNFLIGGGTAMNWTISKNADWLHCSPTSGTGPGKVTVSIDSSQLAIGTYTGTLSVESPNADNSPQTITVYLAVYNAGTTSSPFGSFDTPVNNSTVRSSIPVTGWALDDIEVSSVGIYRAPLPGEGSGLVYIGSAILVDDARPDVDQAFPNYPKNYQAGWGYMMLTNFLPNQGNGTFTLHAKAMDKEGHEVTLGKKTVTIDNANAVKPFGAIDTPAQGGIAFGKSYVNFGWALTPQPNTIPFDGSTIDVWVDGVSLGHPVYNQYRKDIAALFPNYNNSNGAVGYYYLDTTPYENGVHTIAWSAKDDAGNADGIGSRYFTIQNLSERTTQGAERIGNPAWLHDLSKIPVDYSESEPVGVIKGFQTDGEPQWIYPINSGDITIEIQELERLEVRLFPVGTVGLAPLLIWSGYQVVDSQLRPLPIGSTLDRKRGIFYWQPGPGFIGDYEFVFTERSEAGQINAKYIIVKIYPKFTKERRDQ
jgi:hypothetical protein